MIYQWFGLKTTRIVCQWFDLKITVTVCQWFDLKITGTVCQWFGIKTTRTVYPDLALKSMATVSLGLTSKLMAQFSRFEPQNRQLRFDDIVVRGARPRSGRSRRGGQWRHRVPSRWHTCLHVCRPITAKRTRACIDGGSTRGGGQRRSMTFICGELWRRYDPFYRSREGEVRWTGLRSLIVNGVHSIVCYKSGKGGYGEGETKRRLLFWKRSKGDDQICGAAGRGGQSLIALRWLC
jgi:hypothetical protein